MGAAKLSDGQGGLAERRAQETGDRLAHQDHDLLFGSPGVRRVAAQCQGVGLQSQLQG